MNEFEWTLRKRILQLQTEAATSPDARKRTRAERELPAAVDLLELYRRIWPAAD